MKMKVLKPVEIDAKYLDVFFGGRFYPEDLVINNESFEELDDIFEKYYYTYWWRFANCNTCKNAKKRRF